MADFPVVVRRLMQARGVSLRGLARAANYDPSYLSKVLSGRKPVTPYLGARLDDALGAGGEIRDAAREQPARRPVKATGPSPRRPLSRVAEALQAAAAGTTGLDFAADGLFELIPHYSDLVSTTTSAAVYDELLEEMRSRAMLGDADGVADARRKAAAAIEALTPGSVTAGAFSIPLAEEPPYTATSLLLVGRYRDAVQATAVSSVPCTGEALPTSRPSTPGRS